MFLATEERAVRCHLETNTFHLTAKAPLGSALVSHGHGMFHEPGHPQGCGPDRYSEIGADSSGAGRSGTSTDDDPWVGISSNVTWVPRLRRTVSEKMSGRL